MPTRIVWGRSGHMPKTVITRVDQRGKGITVGWVTLGKGGFELYLEDEYNLGKQQGGIGSSWLGISVGKAKGTVC